LFSSQHLPFLHLVVSSHFWSSFPSQHPIGNSTSFCSCPLSSPPCSSDPAVYHSPPTHSLHYRAPVCSQHSSSNAWLLTGPTGCPEMSVTNNQSILHNIPEQQKFNIQYYLHIRIISTQPLSHHLLYTTLVTDRGRVSTFPRLWDGCVFPYNKTN
jgi:hypothetical protein